MGLLYNEKVTYTYTISYGHVLRLLKILKTNGIYKIAFTGNVSNLLTYDNVKVTKLEISVVADYKNLMCFAQSWQFSCNSPSLYKNGPVTIKSISEEEFNKYTKVCCSNPVMDIRVKKYISDMDRIVIHLEDLYTFNSVLIGKADVVKKHLSKNELIRRAIAPSCEDSRIMTRDAKTNSVANKFIIDALGTDKDVLLTKKAIIRTNPKAIMKLFEENNISWSQPTFVGSDWNSPVPMFIYQILTRKSETEMDTYWIVTYYNNQAQLFMH